MAAMDTEPLTIRQLATRTGVSSKTLRYWEEVGLLPKASRNYHGYRLFHHDVMQRISFIQKAKSLDFTLAEIRALFDIAKKRGTACPDVLRWTEQKIQLLEHQITLLSELRNRLRAYQKEWNKNKGRSCPPLSDSEVCCLIEGIPPILPTKGSEAHEISLQRPARNSGRASNQGLVDNE